MGVVVAYSMLALLFLALAAGVYKPKKWNELTDRNIMMLKFGCFFGFLVIVLNIAGKLL
ncbi:MAG: hypothetical protein WBB19_10170 [Desulforhopalus sp.]